MEDRTEQDGRLVRSVLEGNHDAYADIVDGYQKLVASVAWRYGVGTGEIEDVVSEVFVKAFVNLHRYRAEHPFSTWLYRLAVNHVIDRGRRKRKERGRVEMPEQLADDTRGQDAALESGERARLVRAAMDELPPRYREVLFMVYVEGMKVADAARTAGLPSGTVKTRLMRGRDALKRILVRRHPEYFGAGGHAMS